MRKIIHGLVVFGIATSLTLSAACTGGGDDGDKGGNDNAPTDPIPGEGDPVGDPPPGAQGEITASFDADGLAVVSLPAGTSGDVSAKGPASSPAIANSAVAFPPGTLAIETDARLLIEQVANLDDQGVAADLNLPDGSLIPAGPGMGVIPAEPALAVGAFDLAIEVPPSFGLSQDAPNYGVAYKILRDGKYISGLLPSGSFSVAEGQLLATVPAFGAYQLVEMASGVTPGSEVESSRSYLRNIKNERIADGDGSGQAIVSLRPVPREKALPLNATYFHYINQHTVGAYPLGGRCTELGGTVAVTGDITETFQCDAYRWGGTLDLSELPEGEVNITVTHTGLTGRVDTETFAILKDTVPSPAQLIGLAASGTGHSRCAGADLWAGPNPVGELFGQNFADASYSWELAAGPEGASFVSINKAGDNGIIFAVASSIAGDHLLELSVFDLAENKTSTKVCVNLAQSDALNSPPVLSSFSVNVPPGDTTATISLPVANTNSSINPDSFFMIAVRRAGAPVAWQPTNGTQYQVDQQLDPDHVVVEIATGHAGGFSDPGLAFGQTYHYSIWSFNILYEYGDPVSNSGQVTPLESRKVGGFGGEVVDLVTDSAANRLYALTSVGNLDVYDISTPASPTKIGNAALNIDEDGSGSSAVALTVANNRAYVVAEYDGLTVVDVTTPANMPVLGKFAPPQFGQFIDVAVQGNFAYVINKGFSCFGNEGLHEINVTNPAAMVAGRTIACSNTAMDPEFELEDARSLQVTATNIFLIKEDEVLAYTVPASPSAPFVFAGREAATDNADISSANLGPSALFGTDLYVGSMGGGADYRGIAHYDVSNPAAMDVDASSRSYSQWPPPVHGNGGVSNINGLAIAANVNYVLSTGEGHDGINPYNALYVRERDLTSTDGDGDNYSGGDNSNDYKEIDTKSVALALHDHYAYLASEAAGIAAIPFQPTAGYNPATPIDLSGVTPDVIGTATAAYDVAVLSATAGLVADLNYLSSVDLTNPALPSVLDRFSMPTSTAAVGLAADGTDVFVALGTGAGVARIDASDTSNLSQTDINSVTAAGSLTDVQKVIVAGDYVIASHNSSGGVTSCDKTDLSDCFNNSTYDNVLDTVYDAARGRVYAAFNDSSAGGGLGVFTLEASGVLTHVASGELSLFGEAKAIAYDSAEQVAYVAHNGPMFPDQQFYLTAVDLSNPAAPAELGSVRMRDNGGSAHSILLHDGRAYVSGDGEGLYVVNVEEPNQLFVQAVLAVDSFAPRGLRLVGDKVMVADYDAGISIHETLD